MSGYLLCLFLQIGLGMVEKSNMVCKGKREKENQTSQRKVKMNRKGKILFF